MENRKRVMVDMSATLIHHGHVAILKTAFEMGDVIVALTSDAEIKTHKGYLPELNFEARRSVVSAFRYVQEVVESPWILDDKFLDLHNCEVLVHGDDNRNLVSLSKTFLVQRTYGVSSSELRERAKRIIS